MKCNFKHRTPTHDGTEYYDACNLQSHRGGCDGDDCIFMKPEKTVHTEDGIFVTREAVDTMMRDREILEELVVVAEKCRTPYEMFSVAQKAKDHIRRSSARR